MAGITFEINDSMQKVDVDAATPILWILRDTLGLTGITFDCAIGLCGACMVAARRGI
jgi:isoquinoline 1-oxidoreductase alpha subunit